MKSLQFSISSGEQCKPILTPLCDMVLDGVINNVMSFDLMDLQVPCHKVIGTPLEVIRCE